MSDVIEELAEEAEGRIDRSHVERRVADWRKRVLDLYDAVEGWLPAEFTTSRERLLPMREKMMVRYGVPEIGLPVLEIVRGRRRVWRTCSERPLDPRRQWQGRSLDGVSSFPVR